MIQPSTDQAKEEGLRQVADTVRGRYGSREDAASDYLREAILRGMYRPGDHLPQDAIAQALGISRMPVRASLRRLEAEGLVEFHAYRGAVVRVLTRGEVREIYETRLLLECHLARLAWDRLDEAVVQELADIAEAVRTPEDDAGRWIEGRVEFYDHLYALADRPRMAALVRDLRREVGPYLLLRDTVTHPPHGRYLDILDNVRKGDLDGVIAALTDHLTTISDQLEDMAVQFENGQD